MTYRPEEVDTNNDIEGCGRNYTAWWTPARTLKNEQHFGVEDTDSDIQVLGRNHVVWWGIPAMPWRAEKRTTLHGWENKE